MPVHLLDNDSDGGLDLSSKILHGLLEEGMGPIVESVCRSLP